MTEIISIVLAILVTVGFIGLIFWRVRKDESAPSPGGGTPRPVFSPIVPDAEAQKRVVAKRKAQLGKPVAAVMAKILSIPRSIRRPRRLTNSKIRRKIKREQRRARQLMYRRRRQLAA